MKGRLLVAGGAVVALLLVALLWAVRTGSGTTPAAKAPEVVSEPTPAPVLPVPPPIASVPAEPPDAAPPAPSVAATPELSDGKGGIVHDHSGEGPKGAPSPIQPETLGIVRDAITPLLKVCSESLVRSGVSGQMTVVARLNVAGGKLSTAPMQVVHKSFKDDDFDRCVQKAFEGLALEPPAGQVDTSYRIAMPFPLP